MKLYPALTLASALLLSNCATIGKFRKDPSEWGKDGKSSEGLAEKAKDNDTPTLSAPKLRRTKNTASQPDLDLPKLPKNEGRTVHGLLEPENVTKLPSADDLKETQTETPKNKNPSSIIPQP